MSWPRKQTGRGGHFLARLLWDRNSVCRVAHRRMVNRLRRFTRPRRAGYQELLEEKTRIACVDELDEDQLLRLREINTELGWGSPYVLTVEEELELERLADEILDEVLEKRGLQG